MSFEHLPSARQLADSPELASLALLDTALELAATALAAANPELGSLRDADIEDAPACLAETLLAHADAVRTLIRRYAALAATPRHGPDIPF